jgi:hypothetical protein
MLEIVSYLHVRGYNDLHEGQSHETLDNRISHSVRLSGTAAFANTVHHRSAVRVDRDAVGMTGVDANYGNPNGTAGGPTTLSGTGDSSFGGSSPGTSGYN